MSRRSSALALVVLVLLVSAPVAGLVAAQDGERAGNTPTPTPTASPTSTPVETASTSPTATAGTSTPSPTPAPTATPESRADVEGDTGLTLEDLKRSGPRISNTQPSVRMGDRKMFWLVHWPANNPFADVGSDDGGEFVPEDATIGRNQLFIRTWQYAGETRTVHVVYWQKGTDTVTTGNTTREEAVAENITHITHEVTFERGRPTVKIPLKQHDTPVRATMWIEGSEWARWTFKHHSVATTQSVAIDSAGDYLTSVIFDFLIWIAAGGFAVGLVCKKALDRAGIGPQLGYSPWIAGLTVLTGLGALLAYQSLASLVVNAPIVLAGYVVGIFGIVLLETYTTGVSNALFMRPTLEHAESPTGESGYDMVDLEVRSEKIVRTPDGEVSVVKPGVLPFLARVFGRSARLQNVEQLRTRAPIKGSKWDEMFVTNPESDELLYYQSEGFTWSLPPLDRAHAGEYLAVATGLGVAALAWSQGAAPGPALAAVSLAGLLVWVAEPVDGIAGVDPAPMHLRSAFATMLQFAEDSDDAMRNEELKDALDSERIHKKRDVDKEVARHGRSLIEKMFDPEESIDRAAEAGPEETDENEVTEKRSSSFVLDEPSDGGEPGDD